MPDMTECEWSTLPKATCSHCTGSKLPPGVEEKDFRDYTTMAERLMARQDWWDEVEESLKGQGTKSTLGHGKKGVRNFWVSAYDLEWDEEEEEWT